MGASFSARKQRKEKLERIVEQNKIVPQQEVSAA
jgi:hypothetical protein